MRNYCTQLQLHSTCILKTFSNSTNLIISVNDQLKLLRSDKEFNKFIEQFNKIISNKRKHVLTNFSNSIIDSIFGFLDPFDIQNIKVNLYFQVLERLIHELKNRF